MMLEHFSKKRVLIADPLDSYCFATKKMLIDLGLKLVNTAGSATVVLSSVQNIDYDLILCNFELGDGKNGQQLLEELRVKKLLKFTGLFFIVTAEVAKDKVLGTIENEPDGYLIKPLTPSDLGKRLKAALLRKEALASLDNAIDQGDFAKAIQLCDEKLASKDRFALVLQRTKAWLLTKLGQQTAAKAFYQELLAKDNQPWIRLGLAEILINESNYDAAEQLLEQIIKTDRRHVEAYDLLAKIKQLKQQPIEAQRLLEEAISQSPNSVNRQQALAEARRNNGDHKGTIDAYRKVIKLGNQSIYAKPDHYFQFANILAQSSQHSGQKKQEREALEVLAKSKKRFSNYQQIDLQAAMVEAQVRASLGDLTAAESIWQEVNNKVALRQEPFNGESSVLAAKTLIQLGRENEISDFLQSAADQAAKKGLEVGSIYTWLDNRADLKQRQKATELNKRGIQLHSKGDLNQAIKSMLRAIPFTPYHISLNLNLLQLLIKKLKSDNKARQFYQEAEACLYRIRHIPEHHKEFLRYKHLSKQFQDHASKNSEQ